MRWWKLSDKCTAGAYFLKRKKPNYSIRSLFSYKEETICKPSIFITDLLLPEIFKNISETRIAFLPSTPLQSPKTLWALLLKMKFSSSIHNLSEMFLAFLALDQLMVESLKQYCKEVDIMVNVFMFNKRQYGFMEATVLWSHTHSRHLPYIAYNNMSAKSWILLKVRLMILRYV